MGKMRRPGRDIQARRRVVAALEHGHAAITDVTRYPGAAVDAGQGRRAKRQPPLRGFRRVFPDLGTPIDRVQIARTLDRPWLEVRRSEEHTSELQSLMRISYAVFCLTKKTKDYKQRCHS